MRVFDDEEDSANVDGVWDGVVSDLRTNGGAATIVLPSSLAAVHARGFRFARRGFDHAASASSSADPAEAAGGGRGGGGGSVPLIGPDADSARATGYHGASSKSGDSIGNSLSRYNAFREGFVFSDGQSFDLPLDFSSDDDSSSAAEAESKSFEEVMEEMFRSLHDVVATNVLKALGRELCRGDEGWFQERFGPTGVGSQWHVKRYVDPPLPLDDDDERDGASKEGSKPDGGLEREGREERDEEYATSTFTLLPIHTDPSLISVVVHDAPGIHAGAMGLQYQAPAGVLAPASTTTTETTTTATPESERGDRSGGDDDDDEKIDGRKVEQEWKELPFHGHSVATIFVGSVLSYITGGYYPSAKHRVVTTRCPRRRKCHRRTDDDEVGSDDRNETSTRARVAATLFVRPRPSAILEVPPSPALKERGTKIRGDATFGSWSARVSRNYMRGHKGTKKKTKGKHDGD